MALQFRIIPVTAFVQNCSLVWCDETKEAALVDPGGEPEKLLAAVEEEGVTLTKVLLTHGHLDHAGGTEAIRQTAKVPVEGPAEPDSFWLNQIEAQAQMFGFPPADNIEPDQWLTGEETVTLGNLKFHVIFTPGHTPGHVVFFEPNSKLAFVGDVLFQGSIGRTDFPMGNHQQLIDSITQKLWPLGDDVRFVPGHGPMSTFGDERRSNPFVADTNFG